MVLEFGYSINAGLITKYAPSNVKQNSVYTKFRTPPRTPPEHLSFGDFIAALFKRTFKISRFKMRQEDFSHLPLDFLALSMQAVRLV